MRAERPTPEWFTIDTSEPRMEVTSTYIFFREGFPEELQIEGGHRDSSHYKHITPVIIYPMVLLSQSVAPKAQSLCKL
jgi:hypothetical protein